MNSNPMSQTPPLEISFGEGAQGHPFLPGAGVREATAGFSQLTMKPGAQVQPPVTL